MANAGKLVFFTNHLSPFLADTKERPGSHLSAAKIHDISRLINVPISEKNIAKLEDSRVRDTIMQSVAS